MFRQRVGMMAAAGVTVGTLGLHQEAVDPQQLVDALLQLRQLRRPLLQWDRLIGRRHDDGEQVILELARE
jgi:hypothetical protein